MHDVSEQIAFEKMCALSDEVYEFCEGFLSYFTLKRFVYYEIHETGEYYFFNSLSSVDARVFEECRALETQYYKPSIWLKNLSHLGCFLCDTEDQVGNEISKCWKRSLSYYDCHHGFRILSMHSNKGARVICLSGFDASSEYTAINHFYINHIALLKDFISDFRKGVHELRAKVAPIELLPDDLIEIKKHFKRLDSEDAQVHGYFKDVLGLSITTKEKEALNWYVKGKTAEETAQIMNISRRTIETHFRNLCRKLGCYQKQQVVIRLQEMGILDLT